jgi:hypothetical protein
MFNENNKNNNKIINNIYDHQKNLKKDDALAERE